MGRNLALNADIARTTKTRLFEGDSTSDIAQELGVSQSVISNVKTGRQYFDTPWPDGSVGGMPEYRRLQLMKSRQRDTTVQHRLGFTNARPAEAWMDVHYPQWRADWARVQEERMDKERAEMMAEIHAHVEAKMAERELNPPPEPPAPKLWDGNPDTCPNVKFTWAEILDKAGDIPMVQVADTAENEDIRLAIRILFYLWRNMRSIWTSPEGVRNVASLANQFSQWRAEHQPVEAE